MAQPAIALLDPDDNEPGVCPAGIGWCVGECPDFDGHYHGSDFAAVDATSANHAAVELSVSVHREDRCDEIGPVQISILTGHDDLIVSPAAARQLAAYLMNATDTVDPLPSGVAVMTASGLRLGDELLTDDGCQTVTGLMAFADSGKVQVFTDERDDETSDGWPLHLGDPVRVRRPLHGSCVIQFSEPTA